MKWIAPALCIGTFALVNVSPANAVNNCNFDDDGSTLTLLDNCTTDATIYVPPGYTLNGDDYTITAVDPPGGHFLGGVIENVGAVAHVTHLAISASGLANACDAGANRLRAILFVGASGSITHNSILGLNQGASGCQEGNAIEVRNAPFDGTHPNTIVVEISNNHVAEWQKTGILCNGDVDCWIHENQIDESATQLNLAANSIQLGFGAMGIVEQNRVQGNQWLGTSFFAATAFLLFDADTSDVINNVVQGNSDVGGLVVFSDNVLTENNKIFDQGPDAANSCCDVGIWNFDSEADYMNNKIRGFDTPSIGVDEADNIIIGEPNPQG